MERWHCGENIQIEDKKIDTFLTEIINVCKKHQLSIGHEDSQGDFLIDNYDEIYTDWLYDALIDREYEEKIVDDLDKI